MCSNMLENMFEMISSAPREVTGPVSDIYFWLPIYIGCAFVGFLSIFGRSGANNRLAILF